MRERMKENMLFVLLFNHVIVLVVTFVLFKCVFMLSWIQSSEMESTISRGDLVLSTRLNLSEETIHRYDILLFHEAGDPDTLYIKRVIGLPGETVVIEKGMVYVDGVELDNSFIYGVQNQRGTGTYVVPEGCYFFLGDARNRSRDSRDWDEKYVPIKNICAKARFILFPFSHMGSVEYELIKSMLGETGGLGIQ